MCNLCCDSYLPGLGCTETPHEKHPAAFTVWMKPTCQASLNEVHISVVIAMQILKSCPSTEILMTDKCSLCSKTASSWAEIVQMNRAETSFVEIPSRSSPMLANLFLNACKFPSLMEVSLIIMFYLFITFIFCRYMPAQEGRFAVGSNLCPFVV